MKGNLAIIAINGFSTLGRFLEMELYPQMRFSEVPRTPFLGSFYVYAGDHQRILSLAERSSSEEEKAEQRADADI